MNESMETIFNPGSPVRAFTPILGDSDNGIFLEDSAIGEGDLEEDSRMETNLEASWREEVERLAAHAKRVLHTSWKEANDITERAEMEAAKYRKSAAEVVKNAEKKSNFLMNASFAIVETAEIQARK